VAKLTCNQIQGYFVQKCVTHSWTTSGPYGQMTAIARWGNNVVVCEISSCCFVLTRVNVILRNAIIYFCKGHVPPSSLSHDCLVFIDISTVTKLLYVDFTKWLKDVNCLFRPHKQLGEKCTENPEKRGVIEEKIWQDTGIWDLWCVEMTELMNECGLEPKLLR